GQGRALKFFADDIGNVLVAHLGRGAVGGRGRNRGSRRPRRRRRGAVIGASGMVPRLRGYLPDRITGPIPLAGSAAIPVVKSGNSVANLRSGPAVHCPNSFSFLRFGCFAHYIYSNSQSFPVKPILTFGRKKIRTRKLVRISCYGRSREFFAGAPP